MNFLSCRNQIPCIVVNIQSDATSSIVQLNIFNTKLHLYAKLLSSEVSNLKLQPDDRVLACFDSFDVSLSIPTDGLQLSCINKFNCNEIKVSVQTPTHCELVCMLQNNPSTKIISTITASSCNAIQSHYKQDEEQLFHLLVKPSDILLAKMIKNN